MKNYPLFCILGRQWAAKDSRWPWMTVLHGLWMICAAPAPSQGLFICFVPDVAQQVACPRLISSLFVKRSTTLCGFFLRGRRNVLPGEEQSTLAWQKWCMGSGPAFQLCCWKLLTEATLVPPSKLRELPGMAQKPWPRSSSCGLGVQRLFLPQGFGLALKSIPPVTGYTEKTTLKLLPKLSWLQTLSKITQKSGPQHLKGKNCS